MGNFCENIWTACSISLPVSKGAITNTKGKIALSASPYAAAAGDVLRLHRYLRQLQHTGGLPRLPATSVAPTIFQLRSLHRSSNNAQIMSKENIIRLAKFAAAVIIFTAACSMPAAAIYYQHF